MRPSWAFSATLGRFCLASAAGACSSFATARPDGAFLVACPFYFYIHSSPADYWRFTPQALKLLLADYPSKLTGWHGPPKRPANVWVLALREEAAPIKIGLLTVKVGPLAQGGIQMEQGVLTFLKATNYTIAGRKVDFISADTGGAPAGAKTKAQELVERDKVDLILGPLATFELYAINDYIQQQKLPKLS